MAKREKEQAGSVVTFGAYQLDLGERRLWKGKQEVRLTPKALAALSYFVAHPGQVVTKDDLFAAVWPQTVVSDATLTSSIKELRHALRDDAKKPRYIETLHRRGYCFLVPVVTETPPVSGAQSLVSESHPSTLSPQPFDTPRTAPPTSQTEGERRRLTVMFIDLVGSLTLSQQLDPEDYHGRVRAYQAACHHVIAHYDGYLAQYLGDGVLVYFGYPVAHDDDAVRAVRSGLEIIAAVGELEGTPPLQVRIGIHTGPVMVGDIGAGERTERLAVGETPNLTARVQGQAEPNTVVVSHATYDLVRGFFTCEALGPQALKNASVPMELYRVHGAGGAQSRFDVSVQTGLTPLVGRAEELALLRRRWEHAQAGAGQVVLLSGEPGIGKSRLAQELKEQLVHEGVTRIEFRCSPYHQNSAFYPILDHLQRLLQFAREDAPAAKLEKLRQTLSRYRFPQADTVPLLAALLSLPHPEGSPPITVSPQKQKEKTQAALVAWLVEEAEKAAVYCVWEDLHWADPSTLEVLTLFLDQVPTTRLLALLTFRPEFLPPWGNRSHLSQLTLSRLDHRQVEEMVERVTGGNPLPPEVVQQIVARTDGVPLFVEELTKTVAEAVGEHSRAPRQALAIPVTLHDSLMARLDRLGRAKEVAQVGATIGREFSYELLQAVSSLDEETVQQGLKQLVTAELVYQRGLLAQAHYLFKHALIQDTAYQSLLKSTRQQYHRQIAQVLTDRFPETVEVQPELVAHHYTEAGLVGQALPYWQQAGERAAQRSANQEALAHLTKGLELLKTLAETPARDQQELTLQLALTDVLIFIKGYTAPEVEEILFRTQALCERLGETPQLFRVLLRMWLFHWNRAELQTAGELAEQLMRLAQSVQAPHLLSLAHLALGHTLLVRGEFPSARSHEEHAIALYDPHTDLHNIYNVPDPRVECLAFVAWILWFLGYPDQALQRNHESLALAEGLAHPFSLTYALAFAATFHLLRREEQLAQAQTEAALTLATEQGFAFYGAWGTIVRGSALAAQGQVGEGIVQIQQGLAAYQAMGAEGTRLGFLPSLATTYAQGGRAEEGLAVVAEALLLVDKTGKHLSEAGLYLLKGWLLLARSGENQPEAEGCFRQALEIARRQQAKSLELRAAMSLARLWQQQGKKREAHQLLSDIYGWFTEGFDTKDLQEAKALLEELH